MLLNQTAEYAFRAMSCLASGPLSGRVPSAELSTKANIPPAYLSKVMRRLVVAGLVDSQRGPTGGFKLAKAPAKIKFSEILDAIDYQSEVGRCAFGIGKCNKHDPCPLHPAWSELQAQFHDWAKDHTLSDAQFEGASFPPRSGRRPGP